MRRWVVIGTAGLVIAGCGSSSKHSSTSGATHQTPTITQPGEANGSLAEIRHRLARGGFSPSAARQQPGGTAVESLDVKDVMVVGFRSAADAKELAKGIQQKALKPNPDHGEVRVVATRVYFIGHEQPLTAAQRASFAKIIKLAEGQ